MLNKFHRRAIFQVSIKDDDVRIPETNILNVKLETLAKGYQSSACFMFLIQLFFKFVNQVNNSLVHS